MLKAELDSVTELVARPEPNGERCCRVGLFGALAAAMAWLTTQTFGS